MRHIDIGVREAASDGAPVRRAGYPSHRLVREIHSLVLKRVGVSRGKAQDREPAREAAAALREQRVPSDEARLLEVDKAIKTIPARCILC